MSHLQALARPQIKQYSTSSKNKFAKCPNGMSMVSLHTNPHPAISSLTYVERTYSHKGVQVQLTMLLSVMRVTEIEKWIMLVTLSSL